MSMASVSTSASVAAASMREAASARWRIGLAALLTTAFAAVFVLAPAWDLLGPGRILRWHVSQPSLWQGAIEAVTLYLLLALAVRLRRARWAALAGGAVAWAYLRRHHVDVPALLGVVYVELLLSTGALVLGRARATPDAADHARRFVAGVAAFVLVLLACSAVGFGTPDDAAIIMLVATLAVFAFARTTPATLAFARRLHRSRGAERWILAGALTWMLVLLARSNGVLGHDPMWYGFRPEYVLAPSSSLFEPTGLVAPVFYFPKLYEVLLLPLSAVHDFSVPATLGIAVLAITTLLAWRFLRELRVDGTTALALAPAATSIPALANLSLAPKPDLLAGFLVLFATWCAWRFVRAGRIGDAVLGFAATGLAVSAKLIALPYVGVLGLAAIAATVVRARSGGTFAAAGVREWSVLAVAVVVGVALTARTWLLAGVPTVGPDSLLALWQALGLSLTEPVGTLRWTHPQDWTDVPTLVVDLLLAPAGLPHQIITWSGNVWLWLALSAAAIALATGTRRVLPPQLTALAVPLIATGVMLAIGVRYHVRGGDGNYLIAPLLVAMVLFGAAAGRAVRSSGLLRRALTAAALAFALFHAGYSFTNAAWGTPGTRAFDLDFTRSPLDTKALRAKTLRDAGLEPVAERLRALPPGTRVVGYTAPGAGFWLPARYEGIETISYARPEYLESAAAFTRFLALARIDFVLLPRDRADTDHAPPDPVHASVIDAMNALERDPRVRVHDTPRFRLFDVSAVFPNDAEARS